MKLITVFKRFLIVAGMLALLSGSSQAQTSTASSAGLNTVVSVLLRPISFTARAEIHVLDKTNAETSVTPMTYAMLDGKVRFDTDMTKVKGSSIPASSIAFLKKNQMDQVIAISRPDKKMSYYIYPNMKTYVERVMTADDDALAAAGYKVEKTKVGKETVDGHACDKTRLDLTDDKGGKLTAFMWAATDLKDFPVQIQMANQDTTDVMRFRDVKLVRPDAKQFEVPGGLTKYTDTQLMKKVSDSK